MLHNTFIFGGQKQKANSVEVTEAATRGEWLTRKEREMSSNSLAMEICEIWENFWLLHSNKKKTSSCVIVVSLKGSKQQKIKASQCFSLNLLVSQIVIEIEKFHMHLHFWHQVMSPSHGLACIEYAILASYIVELIHFEAVALIGTLWQLLIVAKRKRVKKNNEP